MIPHHDTVYEQFVSQVPQLRVNLLRVSEAAADFPVAPRTPE
jgi:hypothetical protein